MIRLILLLGAMLFLAGCALITPRPAGPPECGVPAELVRRLEQGELRSYGSSSVYEIIHNQHPELGMKEKGVLYSRKNNWTLDLHYNVAIEAETDEYILLEAGPGVWGMWPGDSFILVLRKRDGYILRWARVYKGLTNSVLLDGVFYYSDGALKYHCLKFGP